MRAAGTVLVIDDDAAILEVLRQALHDEGYTVLPYDNAGDALDALMALWERQPDAILLDMQLPRVDGQGFAELYRLLPVRQAPIILMSALPSVAEAASRMAASDVVRKPFDLEDLLTRLHRATLNGVS